MTMSPKALATARRNVAQRIQRFLDELTRDGKEPSPWQIVNTAEALHHLEHANYPAGEDAIHKAMEERIFMDPVNGRTQPTGVDPVSAAEFKDRLRKVLGGEG